MTATSIPASRTIVSEGLQTKDVMQTFDRYLCDLVSRKTVFTDDRGIKAALDYCADTIRKRGTRRHTYADAKGNIVSIADDFDAARNAVYLSAHIDTVGADPKEWLSTADPYAARETATHIIGRGANDCKAGVAFILLLSRLAAEAELHNVVFLISYREEGNQEKTSTCIGLSLGKEIPISRSHNLLLCLENTVSVGTENHSIGIYDAEPCNIFVEVTAKVAQIREFLASNNDWKPVFISPVVPVSDVSPSRSYGGKSGHAATVTNEDNVIYRAIVADSDCAISGGDYMQTSVIDNRVDLFEQLKGATHRAVLNYRGFESVADVQASISHLDYRERYPFVFAAGSDRRQALEGSLAKALIDATQISGMRPQFMSNPGRSDASAIWNATSFQDKLDILTMGPGTRSHVDNGIARKTHGPDEGFHKESGHLAVRYLIGLVAAYLAGK